MGNMIYPESEYTLMGFELSHLQNKKYNAILRNKITHRLTKVPFGDKRYYHYFDKIGHYSNLNHLDKNRRRLYRIRHAHDIKNKFSAGWFANHYLW
jgi:hypothetical protein